MSGRLRTFLARPGVGIGALAATGAGLALADAGAHPRLELASLALLPAALMHVLLTFPSAGAVARQAGGVIPTLYAACAVLAVIGVRAVPGRPALNEAVAAVAAVLAFAAALALAVRLARAWSSGRRSAEGTSAQLALAGGAFAALALTARAGSGDPAWGAIAAAAPPLFLWAALARRESPGAGARAPAGLADGAQPLSLEQLARGMAHMTLKPVTAVADQLRALALRAGDRQTRGELETAVELMVQVQRMVRDVLDLSRARTGSMHRRLSAARVLEQAVADVRVRFPSASIEVTSEEATVRGDEVALRCLLINLLENAAEAGSAPARVRVRAQCRDGRYEIAVSDEGGGIAPGMRERLFQPFETSKPRGTGLGLAVALEICRAHGGTLVEEPAPGGAHFRVSLPIGA
jgi:signal transduction histidine kinase